MPALERSRRLSLLREGDVEVRGRMPWSSNATFLVAVSDGDESFDAIYKPLRGERPLWDFPDGLYRREVAAYELSEALGWGFVPETVIRHDAPLGVGSLQYFVPSDFSQHYFTLLEEPAYRDDLVRIAVFDLVANNTDRKSGHCLLGEDGHIYGIDHGLCFHPDPKVRTVIWDFAGERVPPRLAADLERVRESALPAGLCECLHDDEVDALLLRMQRVAALDCLPPPRGSHPYPWPLV
ncbi:MAG: SCO1664 family protein [Acidimicrobiia bacterium]